VADRPVRGLQTPAGGYRRPVTDTLVDGLVDSLVTLPGVPVRLYIADDVYTLWSRTPDALPFWAFAWPGGLALARYLADRPATVRGRRVLDVASGSGLVAIAAATSGAAHVTANDTDPRAVAAVRRNAAANAVAVRAVGGDLLAGDGGDAEVVLAGDVFYDRTLAARIGPFLSRAAARGALVLVGDPGRAYLPRTGLTALARYGVDVPAAVEDAAVKRATVFRVEP